MSRPAVGPTQPHIWWVLGIFIGAKVALGVKLATLLHLAEVKKLCSCTCTPPACLEFNFQILLRFTAALLRRLFTLHVLSLFLLKDVII